FTTNPATSPPRASHARTAYSESSFNCTSRSWTKKGRDGAREGRPGGARGRRSGRGCSRIHPCPFPCSTLPCADRAGRVDVLRAGPDRQEVEPAPRDCRGYCRSVARAKRVRGYPWVHQHPVPRRVTGSLDSHGTPGANPVRDL
ncbi:unnamed protein product, partial [Ectocarpus sp. 4 AP-2014]